MWGKCSSFNHKCYFRQWGPPFIQKQGARESAYFLSVNRNKKSVCIDMSRPEGQQIIRQLGKADLLGYSGGNFNKGVRKQADNFDSVTQLHLFV
jgi:hypothetical protein